MGSDSSSKFTPKITTEISKAQKKASTPHQKPEAKPTTIATTQIRICMIVFKTGKADTKSLQTIPNTTNPTRIPNKVPIIENTHSSHQEENYKKKAWNCNI